jgi:hypothetical protein
MTNNHYELIKLNIELQELFPYSMDITALEVENFELQALIEGLTAYIDNTDFEELASEEMNKEELNILLKVKTILQNIVKENIDNKIIELLENNKDIDIIAFDTKDDIQVLATTISSIRELENDKDYKELLERYNITGYFTRYDYKYSIELEIIKK